MTTAPTPAQLSAATAAYVEALGDKAKPTIGDALAAIIAAVRAAFNEKG